MRNKARKALASASSPSFCSVRVVAWFYRESKWMAEEGKTAQEITERLWDLQRVLVD
jgi:hypothetical protein